MRRGILAVVILMAVGSGCWRANLFALRESGKDGAVGPDGGDADPSLGSRGCGKESSMAFAAVPNQDPNAAPGSGRTVGHGPGGHYTMVSNGRNRTFVMRIPDAYDKTRPYGLIFTFHPWGGDTYGIDNGGLNGYAMAYYGLQKLSGNGAIFVAPDELGAGWANTGGEDLTFVDDMIRLIGDNYCVDTRHVFAQGFGTGGAMAYALACARATVFRGVVVYAGTTISGCDGGSDPVALWQMAGLDDGLYPIDGALSMRDRFAKNNRCTLPAVEPPRPPKAPPYLNPGGHVCTDYAGCAAGYPLRWCVHQSGTGNAIVDGTGDLYNACATYPKTCQADCPCTWVPDDVWTWMNAL